MHGSRSALIVAVLGLALSATAALADDAAKPVQLALLAPAQIVPETASISGFRLNLFYGVNQNVQGVDWGLVNHVRGNGFSWQAGLAGFVEHDFTGFQDNLVNITRGEFTGLQNGIVNQAATSNGVMFGVVNVAESMHGVQIGIVNVTDTIRGFQLGLGNVIRKGRVPFLPIVNWSM